MRKANKFIVAGMMLLALGWLGCGSRAQTGGTDQYADDPGDSMPPDVMDDQAAPAPQPMQAPIVAPGIAAPGAQGMDVPADEDEADYFYDDLAQYGQWISLPEYGVCWQPNSVAVDWQPYTLGHWEYTDDCGWLWASDEPFGWATCHYGRWYRHPSYGWCWVPGREWGPSWVIWRTGNNYVGWAPLPPARRGVAMTQVIGSLDPFCFSFVQEKFLCDEHIHDHCEPVTRNVTIINGTRYNTRIERVNDRFINHGVDVKEVEKAIGRPVQHRKIVDTNDRHDAAVHGDTVAVYRPKLPERPAARDGNRGNVRTPSFEVDGQHASTPAQQQLQGPRDGYYEQLRQNMDQRHREELQQQADDRARQDVAAQHDREQKTLDEQRQRVSQPAPAPTVVRRRAPEPQVQPSRDGRDGSGRDGGARDGDGRRDGR